MLLEHKPATPLSGYAGTGRKDYEGEKVWAEAVEAQYRGDGPTMPTRPHGDILDGQPPADCDKCGVELPLRRIGNTCDACVEAEMETWYSHHDWV